MFCVKEFADGTNADRCFAFAADAIGAINTAAMHAVKRLAANNDVRQTFVTEKLSKEGLIKGTVRKPIAKGCLQFPLWIKVPKTPLLLPASFRRHFIRRLLLEKATNRPVKPQRFINPGCRTASFAAGQAGLWILIQ
jgi:hypothetical protein